MNEENKGKLKKVRVLGKMGTGGWSYKRAGKNILKRTVWKHILLQYAYDLHTVKTAQSQKRNQFKSSDISKYTVNRKRIHGKQQK